METLSSTLGVPGLSNIKGETLGDQLRSADLLIGSTERLNRQMAQQLKTMRGRMQKLERRLAALEKVKEEVIDVTPSTQAPPLPPS